MSAQPKPQTSREPLPPNMLWRGRYIHVRIQINGREKWRSTGKSTVKEAIKRSHEILAKLQNGKDVEKPKIIPTFNEWSRVYQAVYSVKKDAPERDEQIFTPARRRFGTKRLDEFTKSYCVAYLNWRGNDVVGSSLNRERGTLQACWERAIEEGLIEKNPWVGIEKEDEYPRIRMLSEENEPKLRAVLTPLYNRWLTFMIETGLRIEECRGVGKDEIDFEAHLAHVPAESAKGHKARSVPLSEEAERVIREQLAECGKLWHCNQQRYRNLLGGKGKPGKKHYVPGACTKAGIPHLSPHDLRHTFATRYLKNGGDIYQLSLILGHSSVKITEENYAHLIPKDLVGPRRQVNVTTATGTATAPEQPKSGTSNQIQMTLFESSVE